MVSKRSNLVLAMIAPVFLAAQAPTTQSLRPPQDSTAVDGLTAVAPTVRTPDVGRGATMFTSEQLRDLAQRERVWARCAMSRLDAARLYDLVLQAERATAAAEQVRRDRAAGQASQEDVEQAELVRQTAVRRYLGDFETVSGPLPDYIANIPDITMVELKSEFVVENGKTVFLLGGLIRNDKAKKVRIPDLAVTLTDRGGFVLLDQAIEPTVKSLAVGEAKRIAFRLSGAPDTAAEFRISYAPKESLSRQGRCGMNPRAALLGYQERYVRGVIADERAEGRRNTGQTYVGDRPFRNAPISGGGLPPSDYRPFTRGIDQAPPTSASVGSS